jgi:predicted ferric reductase
MGAGGTFRSNGRTRLEGTDVNKNRRAAMAAIRLPGPALAAVYLFICLAPATAALAVQVAPFSGWGMAAAALGMIALPAMVVQFFMSGRFETVSGRLGIDQIMAFHKIAAWWIVIAIVLHPLLYVLPTLLDDVDRGVERLVAYLTSPRYLSGVLAWLAAVLLVLTAVLRKRLPAKYEFWRAVHFLLAGIAVGSGLHHAVTAGRFSAGGPLYWFWVAAGVAVAGAVAVLYGWRWMRLHTRPWRLASVTPLAERMWELDIQPQPGTPPFQYKAGQFVWMTSGGRRFPLLDNPFSIADSPRRPGISLIIKEAGDFTGTVGGLPPNTPIGIDGPHGDFVLEERPAEAVLLIAGGVGIAPIMGLLRDLVARGDPRPIRLAYAAGGPDKFACVQEIEAAKASLDLEVMLISEVAAEGWTGAVGFLDRDKLRTLLDGVDASRTLAMMCGPGGMVTAISDALLDVGLPMQNIVYERFDYAVGASSRQDRRQAMFQAAIGAALGLGAVVIAAFRW